MVMGGEGAGRRKFDNMNAVVGGKTIHKMTNNAKL